jgi:hypothetical protein
MTDTLDNFPFWAMEFAKDATPVDPGAIDRMVNEVKRAGLTDLFIFSHGWNNDRTAAGGLAGGDRRIQGEARRAPRQRTRGPSGPHAAR